MNFSLTTTNHCSETSLTFTGSCATPSDDPLTQGATTFDMAHSISGPGSKMKVSKSTESTNSKKRCQDLIYIPAYK